MNTETKQATKSVASRLPYKDYMSFAEEVAKSGMIMNDYLYKLIMERNDAPKEITKEVIKEVPTIIYKNKIIYKEKKVPPQIEYRDKEVVKIEYRDKEIIKEVPTIIYKDKIVREIEYRDREVEVVKVEYKEVVKLVDYESIQEDFKKLYGTAYSSVLNDAFNKVWHTFHNIKYSSDFEGNKALNRDVRNAQLDYISKNKDLFSKYEVINQKKHALR